MKTKFWIITAIAIAAGGFSIVYGVSLYNKTEKQLEEWREIREQV